MEKSNDKKLRTILSEYRESTPIDIESQVMTIIEQMDHKELEIQQLRSRIRRGVLTTLSLVLVSLCSWLYGISAAMPSGSSINLTTDLIAPLACALILGLLVSSYLRVTRPISTAPTHNS